MDEVLYQLSYSSNCADQLKRVLIGAREAGRWHLAKSAVEWIKYELVHTPHAFGESREWLPAIRLQMRIGFARPISCIFGIDDEHRIVFIKRFRYEP
jgi:hypothetical protein